MKRNEYPRVVIAGAARTPVGVKCGTLSDFAPEDLGVLASEEAIRRCGVARERIDAVVGAPAQPPFWGVGVEQAMPCRSKAAKSAVMWGVPSLRSPLSSSAANHCM